MQASSHCLFRFKMTYSCSRTTINCSSTRTITSISLKRCYRAHLCREPRETAHVVDHFLKFLLGGCHLGDNHTIDTLTVNTLSSMMRVFWLSKKIKLGWFFMFLLIYYNRSWLYLYFNFPHVFNMGILPSTTIRYVILGHKAAFLFIDPLRSMEIDDWGRHGQPLLFYWWRKLSLM